MSKRAQDIKAGGGHEEDRGSVKNIMASLGATWFTDDAKEMVKVGNFERQTGVNNKSFWTVKLVLALDRIGLKYQRLS